jgi:hypothetical protein
MTDGRSDMAIERSIVFALAAMLMGASAAAAAELPSQNRKPRPSEAVKHCDIAGSPGVLAANGVCVKISGYVAAGVSAGRAK